MRVERRKGEEGGMVNEGAACRCWRGCAGPACTSLSGTSIFVLLVFFIPVTNALGLHETKSPKCFTCFLCTWVVRS